MISERDQRLLAEGLRKAAFEFGETLGKMYAREVEALRKAGMRI